MGVSPVSSSPEVHGPHDHATLPIELTTPRRRHHNDLLPALAFLLPNFVGFLIFTAGPVLFSLGASFTNWDLQRSMPLAFTGSENFRLLMRDNKFWLYLVNTAYMMLGLPVSIAGALVLALMLSKKVRGISIYRTLFYLPSFTSGVALMILWKKLFSPTYGPINAVIEAFYRLFHIDGPLPLWLASPRNLLGLAVEYVGFEGRQLGIGSKDALIVMGIWL